MNDIIPPKRPLNKQAMPPRQVQSNQPTGETSTTPLSSAPVTPGGSTVKAPTKRRSGKKILWWLGGGLVLLLIAIAVPIAWYTMALQPVDPQAGEKKSIQITEGSSPSDIGQLLQDEGLVRSNLAFEIYVRLAGVRGQLQAGTYSLAPSESTQDIVTHLTSGNTDSLTVTFLPGATLAENRQALLVAGFSEAEVDTALAKTYDSPLFATKPAGSDLEGYIYGETYIFDMGVTVEEVLERTFAEYWQVIEQNNIVAGFQARGLSLFEGITLASIVQAEDKNPDNQPQIAQVFLRRLEIGMSLGADATFFYGAEKLGVPPTIDLDSPYNTRIHTGLTPGPIGSPGENALVAVANPAEGDFLYFVHGDDDTLHLARTEEEHEANVQQYCQVKCQLP